MHREKEVNTKTSDCGEAGCRTWKQRSSTHTHTNTHTLALRRREG